eukprot:4364408-Pleurochrysis_carterae.AAC.1
MCIRDRRQSWAAASSAAQAAAENAKAIRRSDGEGRARTEQQRPVPPKQKRLNAAGTHGANATGAIEALAAGTL